MPIYTYRCRECKAEIEEIQKMSDPAPEKCPKCNAKKTLERTMGLSNFQLVGGGWAEDGYG
jgi:putative FmdB family regulatory protein